MLFSETTVNVVRSTLEIVRLPALITYKKSPPGVMAMSVGLRFTDISFITAPVVAFKASSVPATDPLA